MDDDAAERERHAIVTRLMPKTQASGALSGPCLPSLVDHYWGKVLALFEAIDRPLSGERLTQFHDLFRRTIEQGFETSPYAKFILEYSPTGPQGAEIQCELSLAAPTLQQEFQRWATGSVPANELFGKPPDAKVIDVATRIVSGEAGRARPARALDVGAGGGRNALALARLGMDVDAIEPVPALSDAIAREAARLGTAVNVIRGDVLEDGTVIGEGRYALIVLAEVFTHFSYAEIAAALPKLTRALTADGTLLCNAFLSRDGYRPGPVALEVAQTAWSTFFSRQQLAALTARQGLRLVQEDPCLAYEEPRHPAGEWPPTPWYPFWARGHNVFDRAAGPAPIELHWLEYRRS